MDEVYHVICPHCQGGILIHKSEVNCAIFRHGVYKTNMQQIPPHLPKEECDRLASAQLIEGCGKPFRLIQTPTICAVVCGYI
uniref:Uncharacterized protein n=1 Tax=viral metagenome TaxID=1070528 RepID=A0A6C0KRL1_9ZZZZ